MWSPLYIAAFVIGIFIIIDCILIYAFPTRNLTIIFKMVFDALSIINLLLIFFESNVTGVLAGLASVSVGLLRDILFLFKNKFKWANTIFLPLFIILLTGLSLIWTYSSWLSLLPIVGTMINSVALYLDDVQTCKSLTIGGQIFFITYYSLLIVDSDFLTIINLICSISMFVSCFIGLFNLNLKKRKALKEGES